MSFASNEDRDEFYKAKARADRARGFVQDCDDRGKHHGRWDQELKEAEADMSKYGG